MHPPSPTIPQDPQTAAIHVHSRKPLRASVHSRKILWIHGYTMSGEIWEDIWDLLPDHHHVAIDLPGHGRSRALTGQDNTRTLAQAVLQTAQRLEIRHLVGLSFGATISLETAITAPDYFQQIVLCAPGVVGGPEDPDSASCNRELMQQAAQGHNHAQLTERWMRTPPDIFKDVAQNQRLDAQLRDIIGRHQWEVLKTPVMQGMFKSRQSASKIARIQSPLHLLIGENDMPAFQRCAELIRRSAPLCRKYIIPQGAHLCLLLDPQKCLPHIKAILQQEHHNAQR